MFFFCCQLEITCTKVMNKKVNWITWSGKKIRVYIWKINEYTDFKRLFSDWLHRYFCFINRCTMVGFIEQIHVLTCFTTYFPQNSIWVIHTYAYKCRAHTHPTKNQLNSKSGWPNSTKLAWLHNFVHVVSVARWVGITWFVVKFIFIAWTFDLNLYWTWSNKNSSMEEMIIIGRNE